MKLVIDGPEIVSVVCLNMDNALGHAQLQRTLNTIGLVRNVIVLGVDNLHCLQTHKQLESSLV